MKYEIVMKASQDPWKEDSPLINLTWECVQDSVDGPFRVSNVTSNCWVGKFDDLDHIKRMIEFNLRRKIVSITSKE